MLRNVRKMIDMRIGGLMKTTLLDFPGKVACTVFTSGCNMRCPFCHNSDLLNGEYENVELEEVLHFLTKRQGVLDGVCVSGGEPLLQSDIEDFLKSIKELGYLVKLDTNGSFPSKLKSVVEKGLVDYVAMDIKNAPGKYLDTAGKVNLELAKIEESIRFLQSKQVPYEFRTTVVRELHTKEDMQEIAEWIQGDSKYYLQQFVDSESVLTIGYHSYTKEEMEDLAKIVRVNVPNTTVRGV